MLTYRECAEILSKARGGRKKLAGNTYLEGGGRFFTVTLHGHPILRIHPDGTYTLDSCGWRTVTTKDRLRTYGPCYVTQQSHVWYVWHGDARIPFEDGMRVTRNGHPVPEPPATWSVEQHRQRACFEDRLHEPGVLGIFADWLDENGWPEWSDYIRSIC